MSVTAYPVLLAYRNLNIIPPTSVFGNVGGATNTNPIVMNIPSGHGCFTGDQVLISGVLGNTAANGTWISTVIDSTHLSIPVAGNGTYTSGGSCNCNQLQTFYLPFADDTRWKRSFIDHADLLDGSHLQDVLGRNFRLLMYLDPALFAAQKFLFFERFLNAKFKWANYGRFADAANYSSLCAAILENDEEVFTTEYYLQNGIMLKSSKIFP